MKTNMYKLCCTWVSNSIGYKCGKISGIFRLSSFFLFIFVLCSARCSWSGWFTSDRLHFSGFCTHFDDDDDDDDELKCKFRLTW